MSKMMTLRDLEQKWWYRLSKVVYFGFFGLTLIGVVLIAWDERPRTTSLIDTGRSTLICNVGKTLTFDEADISSLPNFDEGVARINALCSPSYIRVKPITPLYQHELRYQIWGSWDEVLELGLGGAIVVLVIAWILKGAFLYTIAGAWSPASESEKSDQRD